MDLVVNEWVIHDLLGENGDQRRKETWLFLEELIKRCDRIAVLKGSPWMGKAYRLMRREDPLTRSLSRLLHGILRDSCKTLSFNPWDISSIPSHLREHVPDEDRYLIELYLSAKAEVLVTTDDKLKRELSGFEEIKIRLRDEFLAEYLKAEKGR